MTTMAHENDVAGALQDSLLIDNQAESEPP